MNRTSHWLLFVLVLSCFVSACNKRNGCTDPSALNFNEKAENDDGSCKYEQQIFIGNWTVSDTLVHENGYTKKSLHDLSILGSTNNPSKVMLIWKFSDGTFSDTISGNLVTKAISIPTQAFNDSASIKGSIIDMFYLPAPRRILIRYTLENQLGEISEIKGVGSN